MCVMANNIKAILFDSGKVLNVPRTGHWFIPPKFFEYIDKEVFEFISRKKIKTAFRKANEYINSQKLIKTIDEEYEKFIEFYKIFADDIPKLNLTDEDVKNIAEDLVYNSKKYEFYDDAVQVIEDLSKKYKIGVVSDAWPSLKNVFKDAGLYEYFDTFIISSILGVVKPDKKLYIIMKRVHVFVYT